MAVIKPNSMLTSANSSINQANNLLRRSTMTKAQAQNEAQGPVQEFTSLGVDPQEIFSSSSMASFLNSDIGPQNLISLIVNKSKRNSNLNSDLVIFLISKSDSFDLNINSSYSRPLSGQGGSDIMAAIGSTIKSLTNAINPTMQTLSGLSAFNKLSYLPVWTGSAPITKTLDCFLLATSRSKALDQVDRAITALQTLALPQSTKSGFAVKSPGSTVSSDALQNLITMSKDGTKNSSPGQTNNNIAQLVGSGDIISIGLGSLAVFSPVIITDVNVRIPNVSTNSKSDSSFSKFIKSSFINGYSGNIIDVSPYADVSITFQTYFPPCHNTGSDFDAYTLFPYRNYANDNLFTSDDNPFSPNTSEFINPPQNV